MSATEMEIWTEARDGALHFRGTVSSADLENARLDAFDQMVIRDCAGDGRDAADWLLALEIIFRRAREAHPHLTERAEA